MKIIYQLLQFYLLNCMRFQQSIFVIILEASTLIIHSAVQVFTEKFLRSTNRLLQVALYFLLLLLIVDSCFTLFMRLFLFSTYEAIAGKVCNFISLYRSPSQTQDEFEKLIENLELNLGSLSQNNPFLIILIIVILILILIIIIIIMNNLYTGPSI